MVDHKVKSLSCMYSVIKYLVLLTLLVAIGAYKLPLVVQLRARSSSSGNFIRYAVDKGPQFELKISSMLHAGQHGNREYHTLQAKYEWRSRAL